MVNEIVANDDPEMEETLQEELKRLPIGVVLDADDIRQVRAAWRIFYNGYENSKTLQTCVQAKDKVVQEKMYFLEKMMKLEFEVYGLLKQSNILPVSTNPTDCVAPLQLQLKLFEK